MTTAAASALLAWVPIVALLFAKLPVRRAVVAAYVGGWLILPDALYHIEGPIPDFGKVTVTCLAPLFAALVFDRRRLLSLRLIPLDFPILVWCLVPLASSLANRLGLYDGMAAALDHVILWGVPYALGRAYLSDRDGAYDLAVGIFAGGLLYAPLCLIEVFVGPTLHAALYGFYASEVQAPRALGWRPMVFLHTGLAVAMWMTTASLAGLWLSATQDRWRVTGARVAAAVVVGATMLTQSLNALALLLLGAIVVWGLLRPLAARRTPAWLLLAGLLAWPPLYVGARVFGLSTGQSLVPLAAAISRDRAKSVEYRIESERRMVDRARERFWLGWGKWGRARVDAPLGHYGTVPDSQWIIAFGDHGYAGLVGILFTLLLPAIALWVACPLAVWSQGPVAPVALLAVVVSLYGIDSCFNAMPNPVYLLAAGAVSGFVAQPRRDRVPAPVVALVSE